MGAWGEGVFDNDTACDFAGELTEAEDLSVVERAIEATLAVGSEYLDSDEACEALAACEVVARLQGRWGPRTAYTEDVDEWVEAHPLTPDADLVDKACRAIERVLTQPSELLELWDEDGKNEKWHAAMDDLRERVRP